MAIESKGRLVMTFQSDSIDSTVGDNPRKEELATRVTEILSKFNIYDAPPLDVACDCVETFGIGEGHFHLFVQQLICDVCGAESSEFDLIAYTRQSAMDKLVIKGEEIGWLSTPNADYAVCPDCISNGHNLLNRTVKPHCLS